MERRVLYREPDKGNWCHCVRCNWPESVCDISITHLYFQIPSPICHFH